MPQNIANADKRQRLILRVNEIYHDLQAVQFDKLHHARHRIEQKFWQAEVLPRLAASDARLGLDLCTGTGFVPKILRAGLTEDCHMLCLDLSEVALKRNRSSLEGCGLQVTALKADATRLPLPDGSVDWVAVNAGLHHLKDVGTVLAEVVRVLRRGGYFCVGHEPNTAFFSSRLAYRLEGLVWKGFWYLSPSRNLERLKRLLGRDRGVHVAGELLSRINRVLQDEGLVSEPLTIAELRRLVDFHAHDDAEARAGLDPLALLKEHFLDYEVEVLMFGDYGGEMLRPHPWVRTAVDRLLGSVLPRQGMLFSWIIRKPLTGFASNETCR